MLFGYQKIDGYWYYFNTKSGKMLTGFQTIPYAANDSTPKKVYFDAKGHMLFGYQKIDGYWYYFNTKSGKMLTGFQTIPYAANDSTPKKVYFDAKGRMLFGWQTIGGYKYYFNTKSGKMAAGLTGISGTYYYFNSAGRMLLGEQKIGKNYYSLDEKTGKLNYYSIPSGTSWKYYNSANKLIATLANRESYKYNGKWHCGKSGQLVTEAAYRLDQIGWNLKKAYYDAGGIRYYGRSLFTADMGTDNLAHQGFTNRKGNCYVMAAMFCMMARELNYDAYQVKGYANRIWPHSWVEIDYKGYTYMCDPNCYNETGTTVYMTGYSGNIWSYMNYSRMPK
jgi:arabinogalactan endo-1,4-beta-galactosidase